MEEDRLLVSLGIQKDGEALQIQPWKGVKIKGIFSFAQITRKQTKISEQSNKLIKIILTLFSFKYHSLVEIYVKNLYIHSFIFYS